MTFLNAIAWLAIAWSVIWFVTITIQITRCVRPVELVLLYSVAQRVGPSAVAALLISIFWLIFGG
jgi:hypothetical protein